MLAMRYPGFEHTLLYRISLFGEQGVPIFFVISGYCITQSLVRTIGKERAIPSFLLSRFRRLYPAYWGTVLLTLIVFLVAQNLTFKGLMRGNEITQFDFLRQSFLYYVTNLSLTQIIFKQPFLVLVSWTLCYEVAFYLIAILTYAKHSARTSDTPSDDSKAIPNPEKTLLSRDESISQFLNSLETITFVCIVFCFVKGNLVPFPLDWFPFFGAGALVWRNLNMKTDRSNLWKLFGLCFLFALFALLHNLTWGEMKQLSRPAFATGCILCLVLSYLHRYDDVMRESRWVKALASVGKISYSLYLTHLLVVHTVDQLLLPLHLNSGYGPLIGAIAGGVSIPAAYLFYRIAERPFLKRRTGE